MRLLNNVVRQGNFLFRLAILVLRLEPVRQTKRGDEKKTGASTLTHESRTRGGPGGGLAWVKARSASVFQPGRHPQFLI